MTTTITNGILIDSENLKKLQDQVNDPAFMPLNDNGEVAEGNKSDQFVIPESVFGDHYETAKQFGEECKVTIYGSYEEMQREEMKMSDDGKRTWTGWSSMDMYVIYHMSMTCDRIRESAKKYAEYVGEGNDVKFNDVDDFVEPLHGDELIYLIAQHDETLTSDDIENEVEESDCDDFREYLDANDIAPEMLEKANEGYYQSVKQMIKNELWANDANAMHIIYGIEHVTTPFNYPPKYVIFSESTDEGNVRMLEDFGIEPHAYGVAANFDQWGNYGCTTVTVDEDGDLEGDWEIIEAFYNARYDGLDEIEEFSYIEKEETE